jgi:acetolactate synthase-1/2/3 large subunit
VGATTINEEMKLAAVRAIAELAHAEIPEVVAQAYGALGLRCDRAEDVDATLEKALATDDQSVVVDFRVDTHEGVFPMVPAGRPNDEIILGPEFSPEEQAAATRREVRTS